jgi:hypothetical protein
MVTVKENLTAGTGIYTIAEAALYARIPPVTLQRWLYGNRMGKRVMRPEIPNSAEKFVTFVDFVQALAIHDIRVVHNVSLQKIRDAVDRAEKQYSVQHPFARKHTTYLFEGEIIIRLEDDDSLIQVSGTHANQPVMQPIVELFLRDVGYDAEGLVTWYRAYAWRNLEVRMNPRLRFGEPIVVSCGYSAQALAHACVTEGSIDSAASALGVTIDEAEIGLRYFDHIEGTKLAA